jgi:hypothetical protein
MHNEVAGQAGGVIQPLFSPIVQPEAGMTSTFFAIARR